MEQKIEIVFWVILGLIILVVITVGLFINRFLKRKRISQNYGKTSESEQETLNRWFRMGGKSTNVPQSSTKKSYRKHRKT